MSLSFDKVPEMSSDGIMVLEMSSALRGELDEMREKQLLPDRYPNGELFLCDLGDVVLKDDTASMEHPIFALSTKPDLSIREYEHNGHRITITPSVKGLATIHDKDILIFAISQIMEAKNQGKAYGKEVTFNANDFLRFSNRMTNGRGYEGLKDALARLKGTSIETNIETGNSEQTEGFGLIEKYRVRRKKNDGTITDWGITLSDWLYNAIEANEVLTLNKNYFRLRRPLERRIYEIARKHCGAQATWKISLELLRKKTGSQTTKKKFKQLLKPIIEYGYLPDYNVHFGNDDYIVFNKRPDEKEQAQASLPGLGKMLHVSPDAYAEARHAAPTWDVYHLEAQWREWLEKSAKPTPKNADAAFIGFCKSWYKKHGPA